MFTQIKQQDDQIMKDVQIQRSYLVQALIVRLMKTQVGYCPYNDLVQKVIGNATSANSCLGFLPQINMIRVHLI